MYKFILFLILSQLSLFSKWQEIENPKSLQPLINIKTGSDFIVGSYYDPYFSFDNGKTWELRNNGLPENRGPIDKIVVENDIILIATSITNSILSQHIMYSTDKGKNWNKVIDSLKLYSYNIISDFTIDKTDIYLLPYEGYLIKSSNFGYSWDTLSKWDKDLGYMNLIDVENDSIVLANSGAIYSHGGTKNASYLVSIDGGNSWEQRNTQLSTTGLKCLKIKNENIYLGGENGFYYSNDFGVSWRSPGTLVVGANVNDIETIKDTIYLATESGLYKAKDLFKGWKEVPFFYSQRIWQIHFGFEKLFVRSINRDFTMHSSFESKNIDLSSFSKLNFKNNSFLLSFFIDFPKIYTTSNNIDAIENLNSNFNSLFQTDTTFELSSISAYAENMVFTYSLNSINGLNKSIFYSLDNGETWNKKEFEIKSKLYGLYSPFLLNKDTLLIIDWEYGVSMSIGFSKELSPLKSNNAEFDILLANVSNIIRRKNKIYYYGKGVILESDTNLTNWKSYSKNISPNKSILSFSNSKSIYTIDLKGFNSMPSTVDFSVSKDNGESWKKINNLFPNYENIIFKNVFNIQDFVFVCTTNGLFFSNDDGESWKEINEGLSISAKYNVINGEFHLYGDKILFCSSSGIFYRNLEELGIYLSVEKTEKRNYLYTFPPFPQPTKQEVKISTYWDSALPFTIDDVKIYNLAGIKVNTENKLSINKETNYNGHIIWDTSGEQAGIYIVNIKHGTETRTQKVMVEK